jgi:methionyl-tRNA synthetase
MVNKYFDGVIPSTGEVDAELDNDLISTVETGFKKVTEAIETLHIADATDEIMTVLRRLNKYVDETAPWVLGKDETKKDRLSTVLYNLVEGIRICAIMLAPFIPSAADTIMTQICSSDNKTQLKVENWTDAEKFGYKYEEGAKVTATPTPLFMRIDEKEFNARLEADRLAAEKAAAKEEKKAAAAEEKKEEASGSAAEAPRRRRRQRTEEVKADDQIPSIFNDGDAEQLELPFNV